MAIAWILPGDRGLSVCSEVLTRGWNTEKYSIVTLIYRTSYTYESLFGKEGGMWRKRNYCVPGLWWPADFAFLSSD